jgi:hypothetical protein
MSRSTALKDLNYILASKLSNTNGNRIDDLESDVKILKSDVSGLNTSFSATTSAFSAQINYIKKRIEDLYPTSDLLCDKDDNIDLARSLSEFRILVSRDLNDVKLNLTRQNTQVDQLLKRVASNDVSFRDIILDVETKLNSKILLLEKEEELESIRSKLLSIETKNSSEFSNISDFIDLINKDLNIIKSQISNMTQNSEKIGPLEDSVLKLQTKVSSMSDNSSKVSELAIKLSGVVSQVEGLNKNFKILIDSNTSNNEIISHIPHLVNQTNFISSEYGELKSLINSFSQISPKLDNVITLSSRNSSNLKDLSERLFSYIDTNNIKVGETSSHLENIKTIQRNQMAKIDEMLNDNNNIHERIVNIESGKVSTDKKVTESQALVSLLESKINLLMDGTTDTNTKLSNLHTQINLNDRRIIETKALYSVLEEKINNSTTHLPSTGHHENHQNLNLIDSDIKEINIKIGAFETDILEIRNLLASNTGTNSNDQNNIITPENFSFDVSMVKDNGRYMFESETGGTGASLIPGFNVISNKVDSKAVSLNADRGSSFVFGNHLIVPDLKALGDIDVQKAKVTSLDASGNVNISGTINGLSNSMLGRGPLLTTTVKLIPGTTVRIRSPDIINMIRVLHSGWDIPITLDTYTWRYENGNVEIKCSSKIVESNHIVYLY